MSRLKALQQHGQSVWLDYIRRDLLLGGGLSALIADDGVCGLTSNPAIFQKAIAGSNEYDDALRAALRNGDAEPAALAEHLAMEDIRQAADILAPVYKASAGHDGYVSLEVSPHLAWNTETTITEARRLWQSVGRANLMIKVPGTQAGLKAIRQLIGEGINVNVTLLFSRHDYRAVADAYIAGLEDFVASGGNAARVAGVASFFISRIDTAMDAEIAARLHHAPPGERPLLEGLLGKIAVANAKLAYQDFHVLHADARWRRLAAAGARPQRLLWASTGTKNPKYSDVLYVEELVGADTVNTMPPATMDAFRDHGHAWATLERGVDEAQRVIDTVEHLGLPLAAVTERLVDEGVQLFVDAHDQLLAAIADKRRALLRVRV